MPKPHATSLASLSTRALKFLNERSDKKFFV